MKAKEFVLSKYPNAYSYGMIDNSRQQTSTVIIKDVGDWQIFPNDGATNANKAWANAKKSILKDEQTEK